MYTEFTSSATEDWSTTEKFVASRKTSLKIIYGKSKTAGGKGEQKKQ